jgi:protocatechuate 3,4-dioxygenase beta subunit
MPLASVAGRVLDEASGQPVAGASVSAGELQATTDPDGQFLIEGLAPGQYVVVAEHPAYDPFVSSILGMKTGEARHVDALLTDDWRFGAVG